MAFFVSKLIKPRFLKISQPRMSIATKLLSTSGKEPAVSESPFQKEREDYKKWTKLSELEKDVPGLCGISLLKRLNEMCFRIRSYAENGQIQASLNLYFAYSRFGTADPYTSRQLIDAIRKSGTVEDVRALKYVAAAMLMNGAESKVHGSSFTLIMESYLRVGLIHEGQEILKSMVEHELEIHELGLDLSLDGKEANLRRLVLESLYGERVPGCDYYGMPIDIMTALKSVLTTSQTRGCARGLPAAFMNIKKNAAKLCLLAKDCDRAAYVKDLCDHHSIPLIMVPSAKTLAEVSNLCVTTREG